LLFSGVFKEDSALFDALLVGVVVVTDNKKNLPQR